MFNRDFHSFPLFLAFTLVSITCFNACLIMIYKRLRGWDDARNVTPVVNVLGLWIATIGLQFVDADLGFVVQLLLVQSFYLMTRTHPRSEKIELASR